MLRQAFDASGRFVPANGVCLLSLAALAVWVHSPAAIAQTAPPGVSPTRPDQNPAFTSVSPASPALPVQARDPHQPISPFRLTRVEIAGSTLTPAVLDASTQSFIGAVIDDADLAKITQAVATAYGSSDIALYTVLVPRQRFAGGVLRLTVVEGFVEAVRVDGRLGGARRRLLRRYLEKITREKPLRTSTLQRELSLIRDMPGFTVSPSLERGAQQGGVVLALKVQDRPVQAAFGFSDRGTAVLGRNQVQLDGFLNGLALGADQFHLSLITPTEPESFQFVSGSYTAPWNDAGGLASVSVSYLRTWPRTIPLEGDAVSAGLQISQPLFRSFTRSATVTAGLDGINSDNALLGLELSKEHTRSFRLATSYSLVTAHNVLSASATASFGLNALGARPTAPGLSDTGYKKLNLKIADTLQVAPDVHLRLDSAAQLSADRLPSSEQLALGGDEFGRAYEAAIISGDSGLAGSAELAWSFSKGLPATLSGSEAYVFVDGGRTDLRGRLGGPALRATVSSTGAGLRALLAKKTVVQAELVRGLTNPVAYENRDVWRLLFSIRSLF